MRVIRGMTVIRGVTVIRGMTVIRGRGEASGVEVTISGVEVVAERWGSG